MLSVTNFLNPMIFNSLVLYLLFPVNPSAVFANGFDLLVQQ